MNVYEADSSMSGKRQLLHSILIFSFELSPFILCKVLIICGINLLRFKENDIMAHFNLGVHDIYIPWLQTVIKMK